MGYINKGSELTLEATFTQKGREIMIKGDKANLKIAYFSLGDSDANYLASLRNENVIDIGGNDDECIKSVALNVDIKYNLNK